MLLHRMEQSDARELLSPVPQRAYAFVSLLGEEDYPRRPASVPWGSVGSLVRPTSAPASAESRTMYYAMERPASPLSRVTNPMVRDTRFRRGFARKEKREASRDNSSCEA